MGYQWLDDIMPLREMPWSQVYLITTDKGVLYLKCLAEPFIVELAVLEYLQVKYPQMVPNVLASNYEQRCLLMTDSGFTLRSDLKDNYSAHYPLKALKMCAKIQIGTHQELKKLIASGVPDWRLQSMPMIYDKVLSWENVLIKDGLTESDFERIQKLKPFFESICDELSQFNIPQTLEHCDFQDNNVLIKDQQVIINDWGDSIVSHPFFSLISFLHSAKRNHHISKDSNLYHALKMGYLNEWRAFETKERCLQAFELAKLIHPIKFVASFYRVSLCPGMSDFGEYKGVVTQALVDFITVIQGR